MKLIPDWVLHRSPQSQMNLSAWQGLSRQMALIGRPPATVPAAKQRRGSKDKDSIMSLKSAHRSGDVRPYLARLLPFQRCGALTSCSIAAISPRRQCFLATPKGNAGFRLQVRKISPRSPNASAGFHSQSLNLCLKRCPSAYLNVNESTNKHVECVYWYLVPSPHQHAYMAANNLRWQMGQQCGHFNQPVKKKKPSCKPLPYLHLLFQLLAYGCLPSTGRRHLFTSLLAD